MEFYREQTWFDLINEKLDLFGFKIEQLFELLIDDEWVEVRKLSSFKKYSADTELNFQTLELRGVCGENVFTLRHECKRWFLTIEV